MRWRWGNPAMASRISSGWLPEVVAALPTIGARRRSRAARRQQVREPDHRRVPGTVEAVDGQRRVVHDPGHVHTLTDAQRRLLVAVVPGASKSPASLRQAAPCIVTEVPPRSSTMRKIAVAVLATLVLVAAVAPMVAAVAGA